MKILHLLASAKFTGAAEPVLHLVASQRALGHDVKFAIPGGASLECRAKDDGIEVITHIRFDRTWRMDRRADDVRLLAALVGDLQPDIIHTHLTHDHAIAAIARPSDVARRARIVRTLRRESAVRRNLLSRWIFSRTAGIIAPSQDMTELVRAKLGFEPARIVTISGGVDAVRFHPGTDGVAMRARWGVPADAMVVGFMGRLRRQRGVDWLIEAATPVLQKNPNAHLVLCGAGRDEDRIRASIERNPARAQIHAVGKMSQDDLVASYQAFDVAAILIPGNDGYGRAAMEAMACGRPAIVGDAGALADLVRESNAGWRAPPDDRDALASILREAISDHAALAERGRIGRQFVETRCTHEQIARGTVEFYSRLAAATPR